MNVPNIAIPGAVLPGLLMMAAPAGAPLPLNPHHAHRHICMLEGDGFEESAIALDNAALYQQKDAANAELRRLRELLSGNGITWEQPVSAAKFFKRSLRTRNGSVVRKSLPTNANTRLPSLPIEVLLRILRYSLTSATPIIDPFFEIKKANITKEERPVSNQIAIHFLAASRVFYVEGLRCLVTFNDFIFTQVSALENFSKIPEELRSSIKSLNIRVVGKYYDDVARKQDFTGVNLYHYDVKHLVLPIYQRPEGLFQDRGVQSYCWLQVTDFLKALSIPDSSKFYSRKKLLPSLQFLQFDLVNFCEHLPYPGSRFATTIRWSCGRMVDELVITGAPDIGIDRHSEESMLRHMVRDEGLFALSPPRFVSNRDGISIRSLSQSAWRTECIRTDLKGRFDESSEDTTPNIPSTGKSKSQAQATVNPPPRVALNLAPPTAGQPPQSKYRHGKTIWKWTALVADRPRTWREYDRKTGLDVAFLVDKEIDSEFESDYEDFDDHELYSLASDDD
ncbi:hypothetical protein BJ875DRAFT_475591 [Amylocarpus encephaloides]|uniref:Uncharacterized protein n=1 Tax=Amylocarpus encephaloides TaxID=45428 RepID=A0A9P7Y8N7_9HELO|nr:hypothetical protein BJ875DRAFT_475591 [Amylocarpus encephaloides]